ncbi:hypothetical protein SOP94_19650 [Peribacillus frigoritolerans]|uniref:hypothetical protein n=1 Tax=Peribacillus frigoritolerans TaxID=450367 RepID=UPI002B23F7AD|nr:hypothetical protein [Peribacillus frigoritolerans]MEB2630674.1 hypothetical protein [Peribacillus frigoritolerans]
MNELETLVTKLPPHIKQWYIKEAKRYGQKTQPYTSLILIQYANENGAKEPVKIPSVLDVFDEMD